MITSLLPEDQQGMVTLIFETEVEGYLQRLESILAEPKPPAYSKNSIMAQELVAWARNVRD